MTQLTLRLAASVVVVRGDGGGVSGDDDHDGVHDANQKTICDDCHHCPGEDATSVKTKTTSAVVASVASHGAERLAVAVAVVVFDGVFAVDWKNDGGFDGDAAAAAAAADSSYFVLFQIVA